MHGVKAEVLLDRFKRQVHGRAHARATVIQLARMGLCVGKQFAKRLDGQGAADQDDVGRDAQAGYGRQVGDGVERQLGR
ncbi:hypothetical protein D3C72_1815370 [compost metagenome]